MSCSVLHGQFELAESIALKGGFDTDRINTGIFSLKTFHRGLEQQSNRLVVYVEGDGFAWKRKSIQSDDPTPRNPVALKLAIRDPSSAVLYIGRPCQYLKNAGDNECNRKYWSTHRYSEEVLESINHVIDWGKVKTGAMDVELVGYSGGGSIVTLIAGRRNDVRKITTMAANLDHSFWTDLHEITPLEGSLNAADFVDTVQDIPQKHYIGGRDGIVPISVVESYRSRATDPSQIKIDVIKNFDHECCWEEVWPVLLCQAEEVNREYCGNN